MLPKWTRIIIMVWVVHKTKLARRSSARYNATVWDKRTLYGPAIRATVKRMRSWLREAPGAWTIKLLFAGQYVLTRTTSQWIRIRRPEPFLP